MRRATPPVDTSSVKVSISIHALLAESDKCCKGSNDSRHGFLSTLSLRRATRKAFSNFLLIRISIHALLAESDHPIGVLVRVVEISIHALLAESDKTLVILPKEFDDFYPRSPCGERRKVKVVEPGLLKFLSTLSLRRATPALHNILKLFPISIHALLAESDRRGQSASIQASYFYPRSPCGERLFCQVCIVARGLFLSTLSLRRAT